MSSRPLSVAQPGPNAAPTAATPADRAEESTDRPLGPLASPERPTPSASCEHVVYLGLGSNLGDRAAHLGRAIRALRALGPVLRVYAVSSLYDTAPQLVREQPRFLNIAVEARTSLSPEALLVAIKEIERRLGRVPGRRYGPRPIDIDILLYDDLIVTSEDLTIPHPRLTERAFALLPLAEIAPRVRHPSERATIAGLVSRLARAEDDQDVRQVGRLSEEMAPEGYREAE